MKQVRFDVARNRHVRTKNHVLASLGNAIAPIALALNDFGSKFVRTNYIQVE